MNTQVLFQWAKFHKMSYLEKRQLFSQLISEQLQIRCEARIYRVLTRFTFQTLQKKHGERYQYTKDEQEFSSFLNKLGFSPSTILNWYYDTIKEKPLHLEVNECSSITTGNICECCISKDVRERLKKNYEFQLASKRLYQILVRIELFKDALEKEKLFFSDDELRIRLRRVVEFDYYQKRRKKPYKLEGDDLRLKEFLDKRKVKAISILRWCYLLRDHPELMKQVHDGRIEPDEVFNKCSEKLRGDLYANRNVRARS